MDWSMYNYSIYTATKEHSNPDLKEVNASNLSIDKNRYLNSLSLYCDNTFKESEHIRRQFLQSFDILL